MTPVPLPLASGVPGSNFGTAGQLVAHPYVFKDLDPVPPIENFNSTPSRIQFGATAIGQLDEINVDNTRNGFLRFWVLIPENAPPGVYVITVDPTALSLAGLGAPIVATPGQAGSFIVDIPGPDTPEPSAAALLVFPAFALLRRRLR